MPREIAPRLNPVGSPVIDDDCMIPIMRRLSDLPDIGPTTIGAMPMTTVGAWLGAYLPAGPQGARGDVGAQGIQGVIGDTGSAGTNGTNGSTGATGSTGSAGATGSQGIQGIPGIASIYGAGGSLITLPKMWIGTATTNGSGVATFFPTDDGTGSGNPIFTTIIGAICSAANNTSTSTQVPNAAIKLIAADRKSITVNVTQGVILSILGATVALVSSGTTVGIVVGGT